MKAQALAEHHRPTDEPLRLPRNVEAEATLLGAMLIENRVIDDVADIVSPKDFFEPLHGRIFETILMEASSGRVITPVSLKPFFETDPAIVELGGPGYLIKLTADGAGLVGARHFAQQIRDLAALRGLAEAGQRLAERACDTSQEIDPKSIVEDMDSAFTAVLQPTETTKSLSLSKAFDLALREVEEERQGIGAPVIRFIDFDAWNRLFGGHCRVGEVTILAGRPGMGKAQPLDAKVLTKAGWKAMGDITIGEELASIDGTPSVVTGIYPQGQKQIFKVTLSDGRTTECCGEHLWKVRYRDWADDRVIDTEQLRTMLQKKRYQRRLSIDLFCGEFGDKTDLPIDPWLLGFLLGDGNFTQSGVRFSSNDPECIEKVRTLLPDDLTVEPAGGYDYRITGGNRGGVGNPIKDALALLGLIGCHSHEKFVPVQFLNSCRDDRLKLVQGLMDSDGWAEKNGTVRFCTTSPKLAENMVDLIRSIGGLCSIVTKPTTYTYRGENRVGRLAYTCRIRLQHSSEIFTLQRQVERAVRAKSKVRLNFVSIEPVRSDQAQCISVSHPSRLYVTDDYIVTHNTATGIKVALSAGASNIPSVFISLEMTIRSLIERAICGLCYQDEYHQNISLDIIKKGDFNDGDMATIASVRNRIDQWPLFFTDPPSLKIGRLAMTIRRYKRMFAARGQELRLVVIDYLQLIKPDRPSKSRYEDVGLISRTVKEIAKECGVHIVLLSQLSRGVEQREDKRPQLHDLRDAGDIEQDADNVVFVYREQYYLEKSEPPKTSDKHGEWCVKMQQSRDKLELIGRKVRQGQATTQHCNFFAAYQAIRDIDDYAQGDTPWR